VIRITVPAGIDEGHQIRLSGEGEVGPRGGPAGNLYVAVHVTPHPQLRRDGTEIFYDLQLSIVQAALGTRATIPTIEGNEELEVRPGTQPGTEIRLRNRGVPHLRRPGARGDLHVMAHVNVPTKLSKKQRQLLEDLAAENGEVVLGAGFLDRVKDALD
jgi:molecular chaperone DnaJ